MAIVRKRGDTLHIQWYDPKTKKTQIKSTNMKATLFNQRKAEKYANMLQEEITIKLNKRKNLGADEITIEEAFNHFLRNNQFKHKNTIKDYHRFYKKFTETFDPDFSCSEINKLNAEDWILEIKKLPLAQNSIHGYGKQFTHFLNFLFEYSYTEMFKINREVRTRAEVKEKIVFTDLDISKIFNGLGIKSSNFKMLIHLLFYTGLRSSDILNINRERIDIEHSMLNYYSPKRKKYREVPFHLELLPILEARIKETSGKSLLEYKNSENIGQAISRYLKQIGLDGKEYSARTFRKTFITLCRSRYNMDASVVRELVGHEQGNTTDRYYNQINISVLKSELAKFRKPIK